MDVTFSRIGPDPARIGQAVALLDRSLGEGVYTADGLVRMDAYERAEGVGAWRGDELLGVCITQALVPDDNDYYDTFGQKAHDLLEGKVVGSLEGIAVTDGHRGQGLGTALTERSLEWSRSLDCDMSVAIAWLGSPAPAWPIFERLGFDTLGESTTVYTDDSTENGWSCPVCGNPCHCTGRLYVKSLKERRGLFRRR